MSNPGQIYTVDCTLPWWVGALKQWYTYEYIIVNYMQCKPKGSSCRTYVWQLCRILIGMSLTLSTYKPCHAKVHWKLLVWLWRTTRLYIVHTVVVRMRYTRQDEALISEARYEQLTQQQDSSAISAGQLHRLGYLYSRPIRRSSYVCAASCTYIATVYWLELMLTVFGDLWQF